MSDDSMSDDSMSDDLRSGDLSVSLTVDASGLNCPLPLLKAKQGLKQLSAGQCLKVIATDPGSVRDFQVFAELSGNELLLSQQTGEIYQYVLRKA